MAPSRPLVLWSGLAASAVVLSVICGTIAGAQAPAPASAGAAAPAATAIVGARIIDGSGNAPFEGTVVLRGDRIAEVGRSVKPPDGARLIEAQGRTVMPGLVDLVVELPRGAAATDDALARVVGAYLFAGVTSIVPAGMTPAEADALRDRCFRMGIRSPRIAMALSPERLVRGAAAGSPLADAQSLADWRQRNVTYVPELALAAPADRRSPTPLLREMTAAEAVQAGNGGASNVAAGGASGGNGASAPPTAPAAGAAASGAAAGGGAGAPADPARWKALLDQTRAARDAGVRVGLGSGAAGGDSATSPAALPHGWATLLGTRLLVDAGLTPLQAVTAATSGGAWALGLQSDRGFLAVGQRADLLIVAGDPTTTIGDLERIERVFLGGDEIDRAALRAVITRPAAASATGDPTAAASAPGAAAGTAPAGKAAGRNARGRRARGTDPSLAAAADPAGRASSAPAATGVPGAATGTPTPGSPATGTSATGAPAATGTSAASGTAAGALPGGAATAASGAAASPVSPAAISAAATAIVASEPLIDDFEHSDDTSALGGAWSSASESGSSATTVVAGRVVRGLRDHALHISARMGDQKDAHARVGVRLTRDGRPLDISRFHGLRFEARGQGRYRIIFVSRSVTDGRYHESYFSGSPLWTPVSIPFASVGQTGNGQRVQWSGRDLIEIVFQIVRDPGEMGWLELDNVRFY